jgi:hypothetical protein
MQALSVGAVDHQARLNRFVALEALQGLVCWIAGDLDPELTRELTALLGGAPDGLTVEDGFGGAGLLADEIWPDRQINLQDHASYHAASNRASVLQARMLMALANRYRHLLDEAGRCLSTTESRRRAGGRPPRLSQRPSANSS